MHDNPRDMEGALHLHRASLINNTFLRRRAFTQELYQFIMTKPFREHYVGFQNRDLEITEEERAK